VGVECAIISAWVMRTILMQLAMRDQHDAEAQPYLREIYSLFYRTTLSALSY
jgi:hypothetical protein